MRLITVEPVLFTYVFSLAMLSPLLQQYIYEELSEYHNFTNKESSELCANDSSANYNITRLENLVQTQASYWFIGLTLSSSIPSVFATFMFGSMSDATGRKPLLLFASFGGFLNTLIVSLTVTFGWPFYILFLGFFVSGITGAFGAITGLCLAYIIDITDNKSRSLRLGMLEVALALAATVTFLISGIWLKNSGYVPPLWASTILLFLICIYITFFLPESLKERQHFHKFSFLANAKRLKEFIMAKRGPYINICLALLVIGFLFTVFDYFGSVTLLYVKHHPLCWGPDLIGYYMSTQIASASMGILFAFKVLTKCFAETSIVIMGCFCYIVSLVIVGFAKTTSEMFVSCIPAFLAAAAPPCIRSIASKTVESREEGTLCSLLAVTETIAQLLAPITTNLLYPVGLKTLHVPGLAFFVQAAVLIIPIFLFFIIHCLGMKKGHIIYAKMPELNGENNVGVCPE